MARSRFLLAFLVAAVVVVPAVAGPGLFKKSKPDAARVRTLIETLKNDPDEKKRNGRHCRGRVRRGRLAARRRRSPRRLAVALQKDASAAVRAGKLRNRWAQLNQVFPAGGCGAGRRGGKWIHLPRCDWRRRKLLWTYHLNGYRSPKTADGFAAQTIEPPIASPTGPRPAAAVIPAPRPHRRSR